MLAKPAIACALALALGLRDRSDAAARTVPRDDTARGHGERRAGRCGALGWSYHQRRSRVPTRPASRSSRADLDSIARPALARSEQRALPRLPQRLLLIRKNSSRAATSRLSASSAAAKRPRSATTTTPIRSSQRRRSISGPIGRPITPLRTTIRGALWGYGPGAAPVLGVAVLTGAAVRQSSCGSRAHLLRGAVGRGPNGGQRTAIERRAQPGGQCIARPARRCRCRWNTVCPPSRLQLITQR